jgi:uncharacterized RmlC-like cupin family protein
MRPLIHALVAALLLVSPLSAETAIIGAKDGTEIVTVRVGESARSKQSLPFFPGVSTKTTGAKGLSLMKVVIPPGGSAEAHVHKGHESAIYVLQGTVETHYGPKLEKRVVNVAGDFIFIPPDVPHQPFNLSITDPAIAIVARNDGEEQEHVILLPGGLENK